MLKVAISSDQTRQFKTTLVRLLQEALDEKGIKHRIAVDTSHISPEDYLDNLGGLYEFSQEDPVLIMEATSNE